MDKLSLQSDAWNDALKAAAQLVDKAKDRALRYESTYYDENGADSDLLEALAENIRALQNL